MSENKHTLDNLLALAKQQAPLLTREQVHEFVNKAPVKAFPGKQLVNLFKNNLNLIIMSTIVSSIIIGMLLWVNAPKDAATPKKIDKITVESSPSVVIEPTPQSKEGKTKTQVSTVNTKTENPVQASNQSAMAMSIPFDDEKENVSEENILVVNADDSMEATEYQWPADTVLDGKSMFVTLTDEELLKLGIRKMHDTVIYCNDGLYGSPNLVLYGIERQNYLKKIDTTHLSFKYYTSTDIDYNYHNYRTDWDYNKFDTLLPVIMKDINRPSGKAIWWFTTNHELFEVLPDRYKHLEYIYAELKKLKKDNSKKIYVNYFNLNEKNKVFQNIYYLQLSYNELINLDFEIIYDTTTVEKLILSQRDRFKKLMEGAIDTVFLKNYDKNTVVQRKMIRLKNDEYIVFCNNYSYYIDSQYKGGFIKPIFGHIDSAKTKYLTPRTVTDTLGRFLGGNGILNSNIDFSTLIPVKIDLGKYTFNRLFPWSQVYIFWYEPDSCFISRLPKSIARVLKPEYEAILKSGGTSAQSCTYFEVCKSTLTLNMLDVYPNPARQIVNIDFNTPEDLTGSISLVDIKGSEVKVLQPTTRFVKGENKFSADLSGISPGIYLVNINTNKGFRTHRIVVTK